MEEGGEVVGGEEEEVEEMRGEEAGKRTTPRRDVRAGQIINIRKLSKNSPLRERK